MSPEMEVEIIESTDIVLASNDGPPETDTDWL